MDANDVPTSITTQLYRLYAASTPCHNQPFFCGSQLAPPGTVTKIGCLASGVIPPEDTTQVLISVSYMESCHARTTSSVHAALRQPHVWVRAATAAECWLILCQTSGQVVHWANDSCFFGPS
jgi:hypothetical protein